MFSAAIALSAWGMISLLITLVASRLKKAHANALIDLMMQAPYDD